MPSISKGLAFAAEGPNPSLPLTARGQAESTAPGLCSGDPAGEPQ